jgi:acetylornithine deacetylase
MQTLEILDRLIAFPTVSRDPNRALIDFVQSFLAERGVDAELILAEDGRKANLFATVGPADRPGIMLSGHTDVVPAEGQAWTRDPFALALRDGKAYGRGTADMKGFLAACLSLVDRAVRRKLTIPLNLSFSHDEEVGCVGVRSLIDRLASAPQRPRFCLIGEPTELHIATGHKGKLAARATFIGVEGHSALAPLALNAIHLACDFIVRLRERQAELVAKGARDPAYDIPYTTLHTGLIGGGTALNIVPGRCTVDFEIRNIAADDPGKLLEQIAEDAAAICAVEGEHFPQARIQIDIVNAYPGLATSEEAAVVAFLRKLVDDPATLKIAFGTEGGLFADRLGIATAICGPGSMAQGHKPDEYISIEQIAACDRMMDRLLDQLAA